MAATRGRNLTQFGGLFDPYQLGSGPAVVAGQPVMIRMQGVPTMPGYRDRPGKWNIILKPLRALRLRLAKQRA